MLFLLFIGFTAALVDLTYFDARGRAEQIRLFFADQQIPYNDNRLTGAQFTALKTTFPYGHVPTLNYTANRYLADTAALNVYLGRTTGLWPTDFVDEEILLDYSGASEDLRLQKNDILGDGCGATSAPPSAQTQFVPVIKEWLFYFERNLLTGYPQKGPYLLGDIFTPVDCRVWDVLDQIAGCMSQYPTIYNTYPTTERFRLAVASRPHIAGYLKMRK